MTLPLFVEILVEFEAVPVDGGLVWGTRQSFQVIVSIWHHFGNAERPLEMGLKLLGF